MNPAILNLRVTMIKAPSVSIVTLAILLLVFLLAFCVLTVLASACLTEEQLRVLQNISNATNVSYGKLVSIFELFCNLTSQNSLEIQELQNTTSDLNSSILEMDSKFSDYYNKSEINLTFLTVEEFEKELAILKWNISQIAKNYVRKDVLDVWNSTLENHLSSERQKYEDILDEKISGLKNVYVTKSELQNETARIWNYIISKPTFWDKYGPYIFWSAVLAFGIGIFLYKFPITAKYMPRLKKVKGEVRSIEELTTQEDLKRKIEQIRELKLKAVKLKLPKEKKIELLKRIDRGEIENEEALRKEYEILKAI